MDKENGYICTIKYYSAIGKNEILPFATMWMKLEGTVLSKITQRKKDIWFHLYSEIKKQNKWTNKVK